jgi:hypothetical protein
MPAASGVLTAEVLTEAPDLVRQDRDPHDGRHLQRQLMELECRMFQISG